LQGSFREHAALLKRVPGVSVVEVRTPEELAGVQGLVIPGGESTTMALVAERWGLIPLLRDFQAAGKPIWGTCAGMIFLAERAEGEREEGNRLGILSATSLNGRERFTACTIYTHTVHTHTHTHTHTRMHTQTYAYMARMHMRGRVCVTTKYATYFSAHIACQHIPLIHTVQAPRKEAKRCLVD